MNEAVFIVIVGIPIIIVLLIIIAVNVYDIAKKYTSEE